jgi:hypothetical protein
MYIIRKDDHSDDVPDEHVIRTRTPNIQDIRTEMNDCNTETRDTTEPDMESKDQTITSSIETEIVDRNCLKTK